MIYAVAAVLSLDIKTGNSSSLLILAGILIIGLGLFHLLSPRTAWRWEVGWKFKDAEPSDAALMFHRITGVMLIIAAIVIMVISQL